VTPWVGGRDNNRDPPALSGAILKCPVGALIEVTRYFGTSFEEVKTPRWYGLRHWTVLAVGAFVLFASAPVFAHQGHDHTSSRAVSSGPQRAYAGSGAARWGANFFPNVPLITHDGKTVRFFDDLIKDKVVMINLIYATCTDACPLATAQLAKVQQILGDRVGRDIFMYSITIDPKNDTPEVLQKHAEKYNVKPGWLFLTGSEADIMLLRNKLGFHFQGIRDDIKDHNGAVLMGNQRTGQWVKRSPMDNPYFLAEQVGTWLTNWKAPSRYSKNNYANAPELQIPSMGENLFRSRCTACHTIGGDIRIVGGGENIEKNQRQAGPDLLGVTQKRDRAWLDRWLSNPAKMLAEKDPIATKLYAEYRNVLMPNFRLSKIEVDALIDYMDVETRRVETSLAGQRH
jgi:cytochrome oxidase Cu insertion factor (SCO1/SenC/PrrC family)